jgi:hypothetical protein
MAINSAKIIQPGTERLRWLLDFCFPQAGKLSSLRNEENPSSEGKKRGVNTKRGEIHYAMKIEVGQKLVRSC